MDAESVNNLVDIVKVNLTNNTGTMVFACIILMLGILISKLSKKSVVEFLDRLNIDKTISNYISYGVYIVCMSSSIMFSLSILGVPVDSIISIIVVIFLSLGIAFKASLENIGSGLVLLCFKPFKVGDYVESLGIEGTVSDMHIFTTTLKTFDNKTIIVPNSKLTNQIITNYTKQDIRRVDVRFKLPYGTDVDFVEEMLNKVLASEDSVVKNERSIIGISKFEDDGFNFLVTAWAETEDYWKVHYSLNRKIEKAFRENSIEMHIPVKMIK